MNEQELAKFVKWLPDNVEEFKNKTPEEIVTVLNKLSETEEGMNTVSGLIKKFKQSTSMFKKGGKLDYLINKFDNGGKTNIKTSVKTNPLNGAKKKDASGKEYYVMPADTVGNIVHRAIAYDVPSNDGTIESVDIIEQLQKLGDIRNTETKKVKRLYSNIDTELKDGRPLVDGTMTTFPSKSKFGLWLKEKIGPSEIDKKFFELYKVNNK